MSEPSDLNERADRLDETPAGDHAFAIGLAAVQAVPIVGGIVGTLISELVPRRKQARLVEFVQDLAREYQSQSERFDSEYVRTNEFAGMVEDVLERVQQVKNEEKLGYWAALLAGVATSERPRPTDRERMIETLDSLRPSNLHLLHVIATTTEPRPGLLSGGISDTLRWKMPDVPFEDIRRDWDELARADVVSPYVGGTMTASGAGNLRGRLTNYGHEFVKLLRLEAGYAS